MPTRTLLFLFSIISFTAVAENALASSTLPPRQSSPLASLQSGDTRVVLAARQGQPRVATLCSLSALPGANAESCWQQTAPEPLIDHVQVAGRTVRLIWKWNRPGSERSRDRVCFVYDGSYASPAGSSGHLRLFWEWTVRGAGLGPIEHTIRIENLSGTGVWLPLQPSVQLRWRVPATTALQSFWVEKGAGGPSAIGTHRVTLGDGYRWMGTSSTYAHPAPGQPREMIPYLQVSRPLGNGARTGWYLGIEFSGRTQIALARTAEALKVSAGLNPHPGPFRTHLAPGESFATPTIFIAAFRGDADAAGNQLRRWVRAVLNNPVTVRDAEYPLLVNNSWGSGMAIDEPRARAMIRDSAELGFEMFHLDAGWFRGVGDWQPDAAKFPEGLAPVADEAHAHGLRFGLWMDWAQAGFDDAPGAVSIRDPRYRDWLTTDAPPRWKPADPFKGVTMDLGDPPVQAWAASEIERVVHDYHLDMLEHDGYVVAQGCDRTDHPHAPADALHTLHYQDSGFLWVCGANATDVSYRATRAYYDIYANLRRQHPALLLEICNDGGRMVDFGSAAHGDYFSISDAYDPLSNRRAFYDASYVLPPAMLESYVEKWPAARMENFLYVLRSGMMGWFTLMLDTTAWTPDQHAAAKQAIAFYKERLRPLIRQADLYHVSPRPDGRHWDGMEYFDAAKQQGALFAFRGQLPGDGSHVFHLRGLKPNALYRIGFHDHSSPGYLASGSSLMDGGLQVHLPFPESSEIVLIEGVV